MNFMVYSLGCKVNQYETQAMETLLTEHGHHLVTENADAVIINTCAVTAESTRKSRQTIRRLMGENPGAVFAVCGCYSQVSPEDAEKLGADIVFGSGNHLELLNKLEQAAAERAEARRQYLAVDDPFARRDFEILPAGSMHGRTRAMLKIEDGCNNFCSYCIIPYARGRVRSLAPEDAAKMAAELSAEGYRELVITGIEISSYGKDLCIDGVHPDLGTVIRAISAAAPETRLHLGSLEPTVVTDAFCGKLAGLGNICDHFHLSLQSGCDKTLKAMRRKYDTALFLDVVDRLRRSFPGCSITTDLITGFPGETEADHAETLEFIRRCDFSAMHIFPYSERPGTPAAKMEGRIDKAVRARRAREAQAVAEEMETKYLQSCVGKTVSVLFETEEGECSLGHASNYCLVEAAGKGLHGLVRNVKIISVSGSKLVGTVVYNAEQTML